MLQTSQQDLDIADADLVDEDKLLLDRCKFIMLQCAAPEALTHLRDGSLREHEAAICDVYHKQQKHEHLQQFLSHFVVESREVVAQVTTHSKLLSEMQLQKVCRSVGVKKSNVQIKWLQKFNTEQQFCKEVK